MNLSCSDTQPEVAICVAREASVSHCSHTGGGGVLGGSVRDSADLKNNCICSDGSYGLFLTCGKKNRVSYSSIIWLS